MSGTAKYLEKMLVLYSGSTQEVWRDIEGGDTHREGNEQDKDGVEAE